MNKSLLRIVITTAALLIVMMLALSFMVKQLKQLQQDQTQTSPSR